MLKLNKTDRIIFATLLINTLNDSQSAEIQMPAGYKKVTAMNLQSPSQYPIKANLSTTMDNDSSTIQNGVFAGILQNFNNDWVSIEKEFVNENAKIQIKLDDLGIATSYPYTVQIAFKAEK